MQYTLSSEKYTIYLNKDSLCIDVDDWMNNKQIIIIKYGVK